MYTNIKKNGWLMYDVSQSYGCSTKKHEFRANQNTSKSNLSTYEHTVKKRICLKDIFSQTKFNFNSYFHLALIEWQSVRTSSFKIRFHPAKTFTENQPLPSFPTARTQTIWIVIFDLFKWLCKSCDCGFPNKYFFLYHRWWLSNFAVACKIKRKKRWIFSRNYTLLKF